MRLVNSALNKGYRFLELLTFARDESSPAHTEVLQFLRENNERVLAIREKKRQEAEKETNRFARKPGTVPLLTKIPNPDGRGPPTFVPTVRPLPLEKLSGGVRKLPTLDELGGHPFLRIRKPQSEYLGRVLRQKFQRRQRWADRFQELAAEGMAEAEQEDAWEETVEGMLEGVPQPWEDPAYYATDGSGSGRQQQQRTQQGNKKSANNKPRVREGSYAHAIKVSMKDIEYKQKTDYDEMVARGKALWKLVLEERALAAKEKKSRKRREKVQRKRERRRAVRAVKRAMKLKKIAKNRAFRKWRLKLQERKKEKLRMEQEARQLVEAKPQEVAATTAAAVEPESEKRRETTDKAPQEDRLRGSQALKATRQPKKTDVQAKPDAKDDISPTVPVEPAKGPETKRGETPAIPQDKESEPGPTDVQPQEASLPAPPAPKKRGRPRKVESEPGPTEVQHQEEPTPASPAPKKRGRPRKALSETPATEPSAEPEPTAPKKRGRPRKVVAPQEEEAAPKSSAQTTGVSQEGDGVSRDALPPTAIHPTGRNQMWKRHWWLI